MRVAFAGAFAVRLADQVRAQLRAPCDVVLADEAAIVGTLDTVDVLVTMAFTRDMAAAARRLRLVQVPGAGLDRIDRAVLPAGVALANAYGHEVGIAEYAMGGMLALTRDLARLDAALRRGAWESQWAVDVPPPPPWPELAGTTLGIVGYGRIGGCLARRARAFDMTVLAIRRHPPAHDAHADVRGPEALPEVLARADYLALTLPLTSATRNVVGARELGLMKRTAVLVNVARAELVDEDALYAALAERRIRGAVLDVWYRYPSGPAPTPPARRPFHELPNVLMTPHVSGWTEGMMKARARLIAGNIERIACGEPPENLIGHGG
jgi:phosphoglycerate dehydrogenase-like enzyme